MDTLVTSSDLGAVVAVVDPHVAAAGRLELVLLRVGAVAGVLLDRGAVGGAGGAGVDALAAVLVDHGVPGGRRDRAGASAAAAVVGGGRCRPAQPQQAVDEPAVLLSLANVDDSRVLVL